MGAHLALEVAVRVLAFDLQNSGLEAGDFAGQHFHDLAGPAHALAVAAVHAKEHLGPIATLDPARAGLDGHEHVGSVVDPAKGETQLELLIDLHLAVGFDLQIGEAGGVLIGLGHIEEFNRVPARAFHVSPGIDHRLHAFKLGELGLRLDLVGPEIAFAHPGFNAGHGLAFARHIDHRGKTENLLMHSHKSVAQFAHVVSQV